MEQGTKRMVENSALTDADRLLKAQVELAVRTVGESECLRSLFRLILREAGALPQQSVFTPDSAQNAFDQGRQATAIAIIAVLSSVDPLLWPRLQIEEVAEVLKQKEMTDAV